MVRMTTLAWLMLVLATSWGLLASEARADGDRARLSSASQLLARASPVGGLRMSPRVTPASLAERPGDRQKERLRRMKLYQTLGIAAAAAAAAVLGGVLAGPAYGTAAGAAVLITYLILP